MALTNGSRLGQYDVLAATDPAGTVAGAMNDTIPRPSDHLYSAW